MKWRCGLVGVILGFAMLWECAQAAPDLVPMPKVYEPTGGEFVLDEMPILIEKGNRQCEIAAHEIALRISELGGKPGAAAPAEDTFAPGIYVLPMTNPIARTFAESLKVNITHEDPGPQGYVIRTTPNQVVIIGGDNIGALYGAMTLRQMMERNVGKTVIACASVYDRPDYRYRSSHSFWRGLHYWTNKETDPMAGLKAGIDWMMRFKLNLLSDYKVRDPRQQQKSPEWFAQIKETNAYALERGVYPMHYITTAVANGEFDTGEQFDNWKCVQSGKKEAYYCWSRDDLAVKQIERWCDFFRDHNFKFICLHPVDGGGIEDPELWSRRCPECRARWKDDERWKASIHQFNLWAKIAKERAPGIIITSPIYPYSAAYASRMRFPQVSEEIWRMNSVDYWEKVHRGIDKDIVPQTWMSERSLMDKFRAAFAGRPIFIYAHSFVALGYFGTWHRNCKTNYYGHPGDMFFLAAGFCLSCRDRWPNSICSGEFAWNTNAPGNEEYQGLYYDAEKDHTEPKVIMEEWVPRMCRAFWGREVGSRIVPVFQAGVQAFYIMDPGAGIAYANKMRRVPLADVDPTKKDQTAIGKPVAPDISDSPERMAFQVKATKTAMDALEAAYPYIGTLDRFRRKTFMHYYRRMPIWHLTARARHACYLAEELLRQGKRDEAVATLENALKNFETDWAVVQRVLAQTKDEADLLATDPLNERYGDVKPTPKRIRQLLLDNIESAKIILKPRKAGAVVRVAIHKGAGEKGTKAFFDQFKNVEAEIIDTLSLAALTRYDCVFILQTTSISRNDCFNNLPRYVKEGGGGVVFQHDLCGFPRSPFGETTPFPEICPKAVGRKDAFEVVVKTEHPALRSLKVGQTLRHMYYDHIIPQPGEKAVVLAVDKDGAPIVVAGQVGEGKVIFDGNVNLTQHDQDEPLTDFNAVLAQGAVEWFTGVKLQRR